MHLAPLQVVAGRTRESRSGAEEAGGEERERVHESVGKRSTNEFSSRVGRQLHKAHKVTKATRYMEFKLKLMRKLIKQVCLM